MSSDEMNSASLYNFNSKASQDRTDFSKVRSCWHIDHTSAQTSPRITTIWQQEGIHIFPSLSILSEYYRCILQVQVIAITVPLSNHTSNNNTRRLRVHSDIKVIIILIIAITTTIILEQSERVVASTCHNLGFLLLCLLGTDLIQQSNQVLLCNLNQLVAVNQFVFTLLLILPWRCMLMRRSETPRDLSGLTSSIRWSLSRAPAVRIALSYIVRKEDMKLRWYVLLRLLVVWTISVETKKGPFDIGIVALALSACSLLPKSA